jgi:hypothetical protein
MDRNCPDAFFVFTWCFALDSENIPPPRESALYRDTVANIARKETSAIARNIILFSLLVEEEEELLLLLLLLFDEKEKTPPIVVLFFFFSSIGRRFCANDVRVGVRVYLSGFFLPFFSREMLQNINRERERERERERDVFATPRRGGRSRDGLSLVFIIFFFFSPTLPSLLERNKTMRRCLGGEEEFDFRFRASSSSKRYRRENENG